MSIQIVQSSEEVWQVISGDTVNLGVIWRRGTKLFNRPPYQYMWKSSVGSGLDDRRKFGGGPFSTFEEAEESVKNFYNRVARLIVFEPVNVNVGTNQ